MHRAVMISAVILTIALNISSWAWGQEKPKVVSTLPSLAAIAMAVGGDRFEYISLAKPDQDPHFVSPTPALMKKTREAVLMLEIGMMLDGWADEVANGSGNPLIVRGGKGRVTVSIGVPKEEVPSAVTRAEGDIHPQGNSHIWLDPIRAKMIAEKIAQAMASVAPTYEGEFKEQLKRFQNRIDETLFGKELVRLVGPAKLSRLSLDGQLHKFLSERDFGGEKLISKLGGWLKKAEPLRGIKVAEYHKVWVYFSKTFGMELRGTIEEKPGIPPGPRHQREIVRKISQEGVKLILVDNFYDVSLPNAIGKATGAKVVVLPNQVGGEAGINDYFQFIDYILDKLLKTLG